MSDLVKYKVFFCRDSYYAAMSPEEIIEFDFRETTRGELEEFKKDVDFYNETRRYDEPFALLFVEASPLDISQLMSNARKKRLELVAARELHKEKRRAKVLAPKKVPAND